MQKMKHIIFIIFIGIAGCLPPVMSIPTTPTVVYQVPTSLIVTPPALQMIPTLSIENQITNVENLLKYDSLCELPCWWGIIPGITNWEDVESFLLYMNAPPLEYPAGTTNYDSQFGRPEIDYSLSVRFLVTDNTVNGIVIQSLDTFNLEKFQNIWKDYQPLQILKTYGIPSRIWLLTGGIENNNLLGGMLFLFYDEKGFLLTYPIIGKSNQEYYQFCPELGSEINLFMRSLDSSATLNFLAKDLIFPDYVDTIEEATEKSIEETYNEMIKTGCLETHKNIGP